MQLMYSTYMGCSVYSTPNLGGSPGLGRPTWSLRPFRLMALPCFLCNNYTSKGPSSISEGATMKSNGDPSSVLGLQECGLWHLFSKPAGRL